MALNPIFSPYNTLTSALQALHESNLSLLETYFLVKIRNLLQVFLEKIDAIRDIIFSDVSPTAENMALRQELVALQQELKNKNSAYSMLEEEYLKAQQRKQTFQIAMHEVKTPLTSIIGFSELLLKNVKESDKSQMEILQRILAAGNRQLEVLDRMLNQVSVANLKYETIPLRQVIDEVRGNIQILAQKKGLELAVDVAGNVPEAIQTDRFKLNSILTNLLGNAVKYTDEGVIRLHVFLSEKNRLMFQIVDTGRGISLKDQQFIFSFFERGSNIRKEEGLGIGLALCHELVHMLNGEITVQSAGEGQGSTFTLQIPISFM
ncbi:MAG: HAMP domain-containing histidine kinase [SAR324 cluster bacterium]|nr:HAMP domain-containing histidine kinase [SAR324 cluster bacterium]